MFYPKTHPFARLNISKLKGFDGATVTLVFPNRFNPGALHALSSRIQVIAGDQDELGQWAWRAVSDLPGAVLTTLHGYAGHIPADFVADRTQEIGATMKQFLTREG